MNQTVRSALSVSDALAAAVAVLAYFSSFFGGTLDRLGLLMLLLFGLFFGNCALLVFFRPEDTPRAFDCWRSKQWPPWAQWTAKLLTVILIGHFVAFWFLSGWGVPQIKEGIYVIAARGHVLREITESEFVMLKAAELRLLSALWIALFIPLTFDWWFSREQLRGQPGDRRTT